MKKASKSKATEKKSRSSSGLAAHREILWRPDRLAYLMEKKDLKHCVFCAAIKCGVDESSLVLWQSDSVCILMNKYPYNNGHLLVISRRHVADLNDLSETEFNELHLALKKSINALRKSYGEGPGGFNLGLNLGKAAGAGLPGHLHYHVIPRWVGDANFFPLISRTKVISETLEQTYRRLLPYF